MDSQNIYYDSFTASTGENGYDGTLAMCESRSASNPQSPGFAFSDTNACTIYMNNGQVPIGFEVPISGTVTTNYGSGPINKASGHFTSSCYRKLPTTTTTTSTESVATSSSSSATSTPSTTTTAAAPQGVMSSRYTETADAYCSNAMDDDDPSILSRYDSFENCWEYCASETSCAACFQPCLDGTGGGCIGAQGCQYLAVSLCSAKTADGCGARIWRRYGSSGDPMLAVRIVLIVVGAIVLLGYWKRQRAARQRPLIPPKAVSPAASPPADTVGVPAVTKVAVTRAKSIALSNEEGQAMDSTTKESLPRYWGHASESTDFNAMLYSNDDQVDHFTELLNSTYRARCTQDRPCPKAVCSKTPGGCPCVQPDGDPGLPASYVVRRVIRVEDSRMWKRFMRKRDQIRRNRSSSIEHVEPPVCTSGLVKDQPGTFTPLDEGLNEFYLWHGTHVRAALSIAHEDFRIDMAGTNAGTMYGRGCYLAENCTKADEYARDEPHGYYEGVFALLLCRVCMGKFLYTTDRYEAAGDKVKSGEFDSTVGDRTKKANTFREFVVYNADQVYPEYVVLYSRRPRHCHVNPGVNAFEAQYAVRATSRTLLQQLAQGCFPGGAGGDAFIKVISARRIEMSSMWNRYVQFKRRLRQELEASGLASFASAELLEGKATRGVSWHAERFHKFHNLHEIRSVGAGILAVLHRRLQQESSTAQPEEILTYSYLKNLTGKGVQATGTISIDTLDDSIQEHLLWHGTSRASAEAIVSADFRIPKDAKHGFRFGSGLYFAEDIGKSLSYAPLEKGSDGGSKSQFVLLCRVLCGQMHYTEGQVDGNASANAKQVGKHAVLANPLAEGPREFIVLTEMQVYPEYLVEVSVSKAEGT
ncbi:Tiparp [Symbiodinium sp. CCMP2456]|nr:Tiparp [Symbiodinium sp. CCMP2456]